MARDSSIVILEPTGVPMAESVGRVLRLDSLKGKRIAALDNEKYESEPLLRALLDLIAERYEVRETKLFGKPRSSVPAPAALLDEIAGQWDAVITGAGV